MIEKKKSIFDKIKVDGSAHSVSIPMHVWGRLVREYNELSGKTEQLKQELEQLKAENEDLKTPGYCPACGSCGESGCCDPMKCIYPEIKKEGILLLKQQLEVYEEALRFYASGEIYDDLEIRPEKKQLWNIPEKWALRSMSDHWPGKKAREVLGKYCKP